nr:MAG TPA_asm: protein of unknown function (DUF4597) [Caudoviricetes sp.]
MTNSSHETEAPVLIGIANPNVIFAGQKIYY